MLSKSPDYYRFVECSKASCRLRFPGAHPIACPLCKTETILASERCPPPDIQKVPPVQPLSLLLDNVRSVFNVGSIFRTAEGCGVEKIYLGGICPRPSHPSMKKTALGAETVIPWHQENNGVTLAKTLCEQGHQLWALERTQGSEDIFTVSNQRPDTSIVLVLGNEVTGIDPGILSLCTKTVHIPMRGHKASLNVATAVGIAAYELCKPASNPTIKALK